MEELKFSTHTVGEWFYLGFIYICCITTGHILFPTILCLSVGLLFEALELLYACIIIITPDSIVFSYTILKNKSFKKEDILSIEHGRTYMLITMKDETSILCDTFSSGLTLKGGSDIDSTFRNRRDLFEEELKKSGIEYINKN